jgi:NADH dehydrogenase
VAVIKIAASILDRFKWFPVTRDQLTMLMEGNTVSTNYFDDFSINPRKFSMENLEYLKEV